MATTSSDTAVGGAVTRQRSLRDAIASVVSDSEPDAATARGWRRLLSGWPAQAGVSALILGVLLHLRYQYMAGDRDHLVLSPIGMQRANPEWFAGDWALANAPQPHWQFDLFTRIGAETGTLALLYFLYWLAALAVFGVATTLLARAWTPRRAWIVVVTVSVCSALTPLYFLGSGSPFFATALPNGLGGCLLYLTAAALLIGRHRLAAAAAVATALAHVQHGTVALVLLLMMAAAVLLRKRRFDWALLAAAGGTLVVVAVNLTVRPVAGHLSDFAQACDLIIPYHCNSTAWPWGDLWGGMALIALVFLTVLYLPAAERFRWVVVLVLPGLLLAAGTFADRFDVPGLGVAVQGLNVYRLSLLLLPFAVWGALACVLAPLSTRLRWLAVAVVLLLGYYALQMTQWGLDNHVTSWTSRPDPVRSIPLMLVAGLSLVAACAVQTVPGLVRRSELAVRAALVLLVATLLASAVGGEVLRVQMIDPGFFPHRDLTAWGNAVQRVVPSGEQLLVPPRAVQLRVATRRAVVVDCKYGPYGGPIWQEYRARIEALGGFALCYGAGPDNPPRVLSGEELATVAERYGADYIVLPTDESYHPVQSTGLRNLGWTVAVRPLPGARFELLKSPSA